MYAQVHDISTYTYVSVWLPALHLHLQMEVKYEIVADCKVGQFYRGKYYVDKTHLFNIPSSRAFSNYAQHYHVTKIHT